MKNLENTYILVVKYYNEYDEINNQEFWSFDSIEEAKTKEQELLQNNYNQKIETWIHTI